MHDSSTRVGKQLSKQSKTSFFQSDSKPVILIVNEGGNRIVTKEFFRSDSTSVFQVSYRHSSTNIVGNTHRHSSTRVVNEIVKEKLFPLIHRQWLSLRPLVVVLSLIWIWQSFPSDSLIDRLALLCSDSDYCGRWRRRYELQPTLCDKSCKRFPCPWFTAERSSPLLFLQLPRITHSGTLGVDMPVIDLYFCICICTISLLRRGHVNDWIQNIPITHSLGPTWTFIFM